MSKRMDPLKEANLIKNIIFIAGIVLLILFIATSSDLNNFESYGIMLVIVAFGIIHNLYNAVTLIIRELRNRNEIL